MTRLQIGNDAPYEENRYADEAGVSPTYFEYYDELTTQGVGADRIAEQWGFDWEYLDEIAIDSQRRWATPTPLATTTTRSSRRDGTRLRVR